MDNYGTDDGRSRAIEAATEVICYRPAAEDIIDRALASGGVVTAERADEAYRQGREHESYDWHATQDRVRQLEAALYLFAGLSAHCARYGITQTALVNVSFLDRAYAALERDSDGR